MSNLTNKIFCDLGCGRSTRISDKSKLELEREGFIIYCAECAVRLKASNFTPKSRVKIYKMK